MKILIATGVYPPDIGGPATYAEIVQKFFPARGHAIRVVTYGEITSHESRTVISRKQSKCLRYVKYGLAVFRNSSWADIVLVLDTVSAGLPASIAATLKRRKIVLRVVGDYAWEQGMQRFGVEDLLDDFLSKKYKFSVELLRKIQLFVARRATKVIVPSLYLKSVVERWGVEGSIEVIPNSVDISFTTTKEEARKKLHLEGTILVSIGRLVPWKGFEMLTELVSSLSSNVRLVIVGDGPQRSALENLARGKRVHFTGALTKEQIFEYLIAADVFLLNTAYEGFSHQILEAMSAGVPIVTTPNGGNREIVRDGENALLAPYNDFEKWKETLEGLLKDRSIQERLGDAGKQTATSYTTHAMVEQTEKLLRNI